MRITLQSHLFLLLTVLVCVPALGQATTGQAAAVLARADGEPIDAAQFESRYTEYLLRTGASDNTRLREGILQQMINDRLIVRDARTSRVDATEGYRDQLERSRQKVMIETYLQREILSEVEINEEDVEEAFTRVNTTITARHLHARTIEEANVLYDRLAAGETFEQLAHEVFVDTALANHGGSIGSFTFDEMDPDFEDAAFALQVGEISKPVRTAQGYSIIQVTDRFTKPILTEMDFAARKPKLEQFVLSKEITRARSHFSRELAAELNIRFHQEAFDRLLGQITGTSVIESMEAFLEAPLVSFGKTTWTVDQFRSVAAWTDPRQRASVRSEADLKDFISGLAVRSELLARAEPLRGDPEVDAHVTAAMDDWILEQKKLELATAVVSEDSVRARYDREGFIANDGRELDYEEARPLLLQQLRMAEARRKSLELVARLRDRYEVEVDRRALLALQI